jgi:hypothetical protein
MRRIFDIPGNIFLLEKLAGRDRRFKRSEVVVGVMKKRIQTPSVSLLFLNNWPRRYSIRHLRDVSAQSEIDQKAIASIFVVEDLDKLALRDQAFDPAEVGAIPEMDVVVQRERHDAIELAHGEPGIAEICDGSAKSTLVDRRKNHIQPVRIVGQQHRFHFVSPITAITICQFEKRRLKMLKGID